LISKYEAPSKRVYISRQEPLQQELKNFLKHRQDGGPDPLCRYALKAVEIAQQGVQHD